MRQLLYLAPCVLALATPPRVRAQQPVPDTKSTSGSTTRANGDATRHAEDLLERGDYKNAEVELAKLAAANPGDARLQYDLGFTREHNGEEPAAAMAYNASIADDGALPEPRVALGLMLARDGQTAEARTQLNAAAQLTAAPPNLRARALRALARLDEAAAPEQARAELLQAAQLSGEQPGDAALTASLAARAGDGADAQEVYRRILAQHPGDAEATLGLSTLLQRDGKLDEADALLAPALASHPEDPGLIARAAAIYAAEGKIPEATALLEKLRASDPKAADDPNVTRLLAHLKLLGGDTAASETLYRGLVAADPNDPTLLDDLGGVLVREQHFAEAQNLFTQAVASRSAFHDDALWGEAAGHLAFAATRNNQPAVALQALSARATVLPNSPASLFLEATAHDSLHQRQQAEKSYRAFLALAGGKLPTEEFQARHRLVALEHEH